MKFFKSLLFALLLIIITLPRFNWRPLPDPLNSFVGQKPFDVEQYEKYVKYFRGDSNLREELEAPFTYRPLIPFLASFFPFDALTSINLINLLLLSIGLIFLLNLLRELKFSEALVTIGGLFFVLSFPIFYYATSGYIDSSLIGILLITNYYLFQHKYIKFNASFFIGIFIKETIIILLPVAAVYFLLNENSKIKYLKIIFPLFLYVVTVLFIRILTPNKGSYIWTPSIDIFIYNLLRIKTYVTFILSLGIPGLLSIYFILSERRKNISKKILLPLMTGLVFSILLWAYSLFAAYADGRQLWTSYAFTIPMLIVLHNSKQTFRNIE